MTNFPYSCPMKHGHSTFSAKSTAIGIGAVVLLLVSTVVHATTNSVPLVSSVVAHNQAAMTEEKAYFPLPVRNGSGGTIYGAESNLRVLEEEDSFEGYSPECHEPFSAYEACFLQHAEDIGLFSGEHEFILESAQVRIGDDDFFSLQATICTAVNDHTDKFCKSEYKRSIACVWYDSHPDEAPLKCAPESSTSARNIFNSGRIVMLTVVVALIGVVSGATDFA